MATTLRSPNIGALALTGLAWAVMPGATQPQIRDAGPTDAIAYIRSSVEQFPIVVLAEGSHATLEPHLFLRRVVSDPGVLETVDVIMVEFAAGRQQPVLDAYIRGEDVPFERLSRVWRDTGQSPMGPWDSPLYQELLAVIRDANLKLPPEHRVRVLAGDPPIDWENIQTSDDFQAAITNRDTYGAGLAIEQAFGQDQKVLIIFGGAHLPKVALAQDDPRNSMTYRILSQHPGTVRAIGFLNPEYLGIEDRIPELEEGAIYVTASHWVGEIGAGAFFPGLVMPVVDPDTGERTLRPVTVYAQYQVRDLFDALVYIGPSSQWQVVEPSLDPVRDRAYLAELNRRSMIRYGRPYRSGG